MATNYKMGQYRYAGNATDSGSPCATIFNTYPNSDPDDSNKLKPVYQQVDSNSDTEIYYQDVLIPLTSSYLSTSDLFYIDLDVAASGLADTTYDLKLVDSATYDESTGLYDFTNFETVATFTVPKTSSTATSAIGVSLYVPAGKSATYPPQVGRIKANKYDSQGELLLENNILTDAKGNVISYHNDVFLLPSWVSDVPEWIKYDYSTLISTKYKTAMFDSLLLEVRRSDVDKKVLTEVDGKQIMGRFLNVSDPSADHLDITIKQIKEILPAKKTTIKQIGIWGRPNLPMSINGEEVRIGPSGYFELKNFDITSFGVCAIGENDKFTVDYLYENNS